MISSFYLTHESSGALIPAYTNLGLGAEFDAIGDVIVAEEGEIARNYLDLYLQPSARKNYDDLGRRSKRGELGCGHPLIIIIISI